VRFERRVIDGIAREVRDGEAGGILLGRCPRHGSQQSGELVVEDFEPVLCEHRFGASYRLSEEDLCGLEESLAWFRDPRQGLEVLGFYRSRTDDLPPNEQDGDLMRRFFDAPGLLFLLLKPGPMETIDASLHRLSEGTLEPASDAMTFRLEAESGIPLGQPPAAEPPAGERQLLAPAAQPEALPPLPSHRLPPPHRRARRLETVELPSRSRWWIAAAILTIAGAALGYLSAVNRPVPQPHRQEPGAHSRPAAAIIPPAAYFPQTKLAASSVLPAPLYFATSGYGHSGRVLAPPRATTSWGAVFCSTQRSRGAAMSKLLGPDPPPQCCIPGTM